MKRDFYIELKIVTHNLTDALKCASLLRIVLKSCEKVIAIKRESSTEFQEDKLQLNYHYIIGLSVPANNFFEFIQFWDNLPLNKELIQNDANYYITELTPFEIVD
jgi:hypothetical protein